MRILVEDMDCSQRLSRVALRFQPMGGQHIQNEEPSKKFSYHRPLTAVLIRDEKKKFLSNTAQRLVEQLADNFGPYVKVLPVDENGNIMGLFKEPPSVIGFP